MCYVSYLSDQHHRSQVQHLTSGVPGNSYKKYPSQDTAIDAYALAWSLGAVRRVR